MFGWELTLDLHNLHLGVGLSVTDLLLLVLLGLVLQNIEFFALAVFQDLSGHFCSGNDRRTDLEAVVIRQSLDLIENDLVPLGNLELLDEDDVLLDYFVLLSAGFDNCKHEKHLSFS